MKKKTIKWILGIIGLIFLGALGSGLWQIVIKPLTFWFLETIFNIMTLGLSSLSDAFYTEVAEGLHEEPSLENLTLLLIIIFTCCVIKLGDILGERSASRVKKELDDKIEEYKKLPPDKGAVLIQKAKDEHNKYIEYLKRSYKRSTRLCIIFGVIFLSFLTSRHVTIGLRNHKVTKFHQLFTICKPFLDDQEEERILAKFSAIRTRQDYLDIIMILVRKTIEHTQDLPDSIDIQKEPK